MGSADMNSRSLLEALEDICNVDVDAIDPKVSTSLPFKAHNRMNTTPCETYQRKVY